MTTRFATRLAIACGVTLGCVVSACSESPSNDGGGSGGATSTTGGASATTGGAMTTTGGAMATTGGAMTTTGGAMATTGGAMATTGGAAATTGGASSSTGGQVGGSGGPATGGKSAGTGGSAASGGATSSGGAKSTGGASTGGATSSGGAAAGSTSVAGGPSSGCGKAGAATGAQDKQITVGTEARTYVLFVPTGYTESTPMPLLFAWHGLGGTGKLARQYFRIEQAAANKAIIVYPDALPLANQNNMTGWNLSATGNDVAFFDALLKEVTSSLCIDSNRIFSAGHSFGAMITNALGCYRGDVLRAIAPVAGSPPGRGNVTCAGEVAAWIAHGENDTTVDYMTSGIPSRDFWLGKNGCTMTSEATTPSPCVAYQGCRDGLPVHWCVHQNMHDWPSFAGAGIWAFFAGFN